MFAQHLGGIADATDDTQTTGVGDSSGQLGTRSHVHACQQDGVVDLKQISDRGTDLFCFVIMVSIDVVAMCLCGALRQVEGDHMKIMGIVKDNLGRHLRGDAIMKVCGVKVMKKIKPGEEEGWGCSQPIKQSNLGGSQTRDEPRSKRLDREISHDVTTRGQGTAVAGIETDT